MAENRAHAPGTEVIGSAVSSHKMLAMTGSPQGGSGNFGVGAIPGTSKIAARSGDTGKVVADSDRCCGISMGRGSMNATRHSDHGPHDHGSVYSRR